MNLTDKELKEIDINDKIDNYVKWFREDCGDPYGELEWFIKTLVRTEHKEDIMDILNDTYVLYKNN